MKHENPVTARDWQRAVDEEAARILASGADLTIEEAEAQAALNVSATRKARIAQSTLEAANL